MIKTINKNFLILLGIFIGASALRVLLNNTPYIDIVIAFINITSLLYVFYLIVEDSLKCLNNLIEAHPNIGYKIKEKKRNHFKKFNNLICVFVLVIGVLYSLLMANSVVNDIIGTITLFMSIQSTYISECIGILYNKKN